MKKIILFTLLNIYFLLNVNSQILISLLLGDDLNSDKLEFGIETGVNFSSIGGLETTEYLRSWNIGFYFDLSIKENTPWNLYTGVLVKSGLGIDKLTKNDVKLLSENTIIYSDDGSYIQKINTFIIPIFLKYKFNKSFFIETGPQLDLMYNSWLEYEYETDNEYHLSKYNNKELFNKIDIGVGAGTGYRFKGRTGWTVGIKYYYGLTNAIKSTDKSMNQSLFLKVNIPIGRSLEAQRKREAKKAKRETKRKAKLKENK